ncbi:nitroreductase family protein [Candidatus Oscillochloris fontis]|uniref:nitroreductase family protein n=1 Tax=Candidatus Oscillochloris fontis TaxID=2496868 RepID=UPI00101B91A1|nr:nitroreductase family protein [Candidatus Oscillochloris fontis]
MLTVPNAIEARRSIRRYTSEPISEADLHEILRLTCLAPSSMNVQPWRFVVIQNAELQQQLRVVAYDQAQVTAAPALIVIYSDMEDALAHAEETVHPGMGEEQVRSRAEGMRQNFAKMSIEERANWANAQSNIALGFLVLAAQSMGYATSAMLGFMHEEVKTLLNLPAHATITAMIALGRPDEAGYPHHRHRVERITTFRA